MKDEHHGTDPRINKYPSNHSLYNLTKNIQPLFSVIEEEILPESNIDDSSTCLETLKEILNGVSDYIDERMDNIIYYQNVNIDYEYEKRKGDNICEAFLITGIDESSGDTQYLNESEIFSASCGHLTCGVLKAFRPKILYKFPHEKLDYLDLNQTLASFTFPKGLKFCYEEEKDLKSQKFISTITTENGQRLYMTTMQVYMKQDYLEYMRKSLVDPVKAFFKSEAENVSEFFFEQITNFINKDYVYIPIAFSFISSSPNYSAVEKFLDSIITLVNNNEKKLFAEFLKNVIYEIPIPQRKSVYNIMLPSSLDKAEVFNKVYEEKPVLNYSCFNILKYFTVENVKLIIRLILFEKKIIFVTDKSDWELLSKVCESFLSLVYPISWVHFYEPTLSYEILKYVQSFLPYIIGIDSSMLSTVVSYLDQESEIFIVNILENSVYHFKSSKKNLLKNSDFLPNFPKNSETFLTKEMNGLKDNLKGNEGLYFDKIIFCDMREIFVKLMAILFEDYKKYSVMIGSMPNFNSSNYIENQAKEDRLFFKEIVESQNFLQFVQASYMQEERDYMKYFESTCSNFRSIYIQDTKSTTTIQKFKLDLCEFTKRRPSQAEQIHSFKLTMDGKRKSQILNNNTLFDVKNIDFNSPQLMRDTIANRNRAKTIAANVFPNLNVSKNFDILNNTHIKQNIIIKYLQPYFIKAGNVLKLEEIEDVIFTISEKLINKNLNILSISDIKQVIVYLNNNNSIITSLNKYETDNFQTSEPLSKDYLNDNLNNSSKDQIHKEDKQNDGLSGLLLSEKVDEIQQQTEKIEKKRLTIINTESNTDKPHILRKQSLAFFLLNSSNFKNSKSYTEKIQEIINDYFSAIFTSNLKQETLDVALLVNSRYARSKLANTLYQEKFKSNTVHLLDDKSFHSLKNILFNCLLCSQIDNNDYEDVRLITKSTFHYYKHEQDKNKTRNLYLYKELIKGKGVFNIWKEKDFWVFYVESDLCEYYPILKENFFNSDAYNFHIICQVAKEMTELKIEASLVHSLLVENIGKKYITKEFLIKDLISCLKRLKEN